MVSTRRTPLLAALIVLAIAQFSPVRFQAQAPDPCAPPLGNRIKCENALPGTPESEWGIAGAGDPSIQGFTTDISVNRGQTIRFKVATNALAYRLDIYRLGYYNGLGARRVATVTPSAQLPQNQPSCLHDVATGLVDCGNWSESASWAVPTNATSGLFFARLVRTDTNGASHVYFVVRDDSGQSDVLVQTSDTTWAAYNDYGGNSLYQGEPAGRAYKVSYNRPLINRGGPYRRGSFWVSEYPMIRFVEANGFDASYTTGVDTDRRPAELLEHNMFLSVGHDEYWSETQRANIEAARDAGVHLAFLSGNAIFWKTRWESSIDPSNTDRRTLVTYKETHANQQIDPTGEWTGTWRDPRFSPPADGGRPENALKGSMFVVNCCRADPLNVSEEEGKRRFWRNTSLATLPVGQSQLVGTSVVGFEFDGDVDNGFRPAGLFRLSTHVMPVQSLLLDYGSNYGAGTAMHNLTLYRALSGALVFASGSIQWSWGLDTVHDNPDGLPVATDARIRQATINLFADMGAQPTTLQAGLAAASASTDTSPPTATITFPTNGLQVLLNQPVNISGSATDVGGTASGIEVSVDNGATWRPANGARNWTYSWTPTSLGSSTIRGRAVDDSGNLQSSPTTVTVTVVSSDTQGPTIASRVPTPGATGVSAAAAVTVTFSESMTASTINGTTFELRNSANQLVPATVTYDGASYTATLRPTTTLAFTAAYSARVRGGSSGVKDLAGNPLAADATWSFTTGAAPPCPCTIWSPSATPSIIDSGDTNSYELGVKFRADFDGFISGLRFYKSAANIGTHVGHLWASNGTLLGTVTFTGETGSGWQEAYFPAPVSVSANTTYVASYHTPNGRYSSSLDYFDSGAVYNAPLRALGAAESPNGVFKSGTSGFPTLTYRNANYWVDVVFTSAGGDTTGPTVTSHVPATGATSVPAGAPITVTFSEAMQSASLTTTTIDLRNAANQAVAGSIAYNAAARTATLTPSQTLAFGASYTVRVLGGAAGVQDSVGNDMAADVVWGFTTGAPPVCPCSIWDPATTVPAIQSFGDTNAYELGVRFRSQMDGYVTGVRFYKGAGNTGTHIGNLWSATGQLLATATFLNETATGWQEVVFDSPVPVATGVGYVASYHTTTGRYAVDAGYFNAGGVTRGPLYAFAASEGGNAVYASGASAFPSSTYNGNNYWVDVVFTTTGGGGGSDLTAPTIVARTPAPSAVGVATTTNVTAQFSEAMNASSISSSSVDLRTSGGQLVAATVSYNPSTRTATLDPTATLAADATFTARVRGGSAGATDLAGNVLASDVTWTFTTAAAATCPCSLWSTSTTPAIVDSNDGNSYELGVRFRTDTDGVISGIRFYKSAGNTGTHIGHLWSSTGTVLATATFTNESASGWQEVIFPSPVAVTAGTVYVASYWAPVGHYSGDLNYFGSGPITAGPLQALANAEGGNGVFRAGSSGFPTSTYNAANYWVDVLFGVPGSDTTPPTVVSRAPLPGATGVSIGTTVQVTFSEAMSAASLTGSTLEIRGPGNQLVNAAVSYSASTRTATIDPAADLAASTAYTVNVIGGAAGVADLAGNRLVATVSWSFTTGTGLGCPCSIWDPATTVPAIIDSGDNQAYELGVKFQTQVNGSITGIRFYKSAANTGTHVGHLWSSAGALLGTVTFTGETASGWQVASFSAPIAVTAGTTYVVSYFAPNGRYSGNIGYFSSGGSGTVVQALSNTVTPNGVYRPSTIGFPTETYNAANYWVDVVFVTP